MCPGLPVPPLQWDPHSQGAGRGGLEVQGHPEVPAAHGPGQCSWLNSQPSCGSKPSLILTPTGALGAKSPFLQTCSFMGSTGTTWPWLAAGMAEPQWIKAHREQTHIHQNTTQLSPMQGPSATARGWAEPPRGQTLATISPRGARASCQAGGARGEQFAGVLICRRQEAILRLPLGYEQQLTQETRAP